MRVGNGGMHWWEGRSYCFIPHGVTRIIYNMLPTFLDAGAVFCSSTRLPQLSDILRRRAERRLLVCPTSDSLLVGGGEVFADVQRVRRGRRLRRLGLLHQSIPLRPVLLRHSLVPRPLPGRQRRPLRMRSLNSIPRRLLPLQLLRQEHVPRARRPRLLPHQPVLLTALGPLKRHTRRRECLPRRPQRSLLLPDRNLSRLLRTESLRQGSTRDRLHLLHGLGLLGLLAAGRIGLLRSRYRPLQRFLQLLRRACLFLLILRRLHHLREHHDAHTRGLRRCHRTLPQRRSLLLRSSGLRRLRCLRSSSLRPSLQLRHPRRDGRRRPLRSFE
eukprot:Hpha_TRINITY_DN16986_c1_g2::TRINITY_DN16986_c1_g2_i15::g.52586::m.52586